MLFDRVPLIYIFVCNYLAKCRCDINIREVLVHNFVLLRFIKNNLCYLHGVGPKYEGFTIESPFLTFVQLVTFMKMFHIFQNFVKFTLHQIFHPYEIFVPFVSWCWPRIDRVNH